MTIAGHVFTLEGQCSCGKRFQDISGASEEHVGTHGWAHSGHLVAYELAEIRAEVRRIWELTIGAATGNGPASRSINDEIEAAEAA